MKRHEELALAAFLQDELSHTELDELREIFARDETAEDEFCSLLELEGALRGQCSRDVVDATMEQIQRRQRVEKHVMDTVWAVDEARKSVVQQTPRQIPATWWKWAVAGAACILVATAIYQSGWFGQESNQLVADLPLIIRTEGEVQVAMTDGALESISVGRQIHVDETLQVGGEDGEVVLRYVDGTQIELIGTGSLAISRTSQGGKQLQLLSGFLRADVAKQPTKRPLVIVTPHVSVRVLGTRFDLTADKEQGTRLDLESGHVELIRGEELPVAVEPNQIAVVPATPDSIQILSRPTVVESPQREMKLRSVSSIEYSADGKAIVGLGGSHVVYWYKDDRLEAIPAVNDRVGKVRFQGQSGPFVAFEELAHDRLTIWNTQDRRLAHVFEDFESLPRFFTQSRDRNNKYALPGRKRALSPQGDWAAFEYYGGGFMVWHCKSGTWRDLGYRGRASSIAVSPDGRLLALHHWKGIAVEFFDVREGKRVDRWPLPDGHSRAPSALCFSADGKSLVIGSRGQVQIFRVATGELHRSFRQSSVRFNRVALSPDGRYLAAASEDRVVRLWDMKARSESPVCRFKGGVRDLKFAPDSRELAALGRYGRAMTWELPPTVKP